jgi:poly-gamma-glutamate synthesis protein (capsule biosynthesis protein)
MDYGREGLARTLQAGSGKRPVIIGVGNNIGEALKPYRANVRGRGVTVFAGSDVLDEGFDWAATETESGVAIIKSMPQFAAMRDAVAAARKARPDDVVAVFLHGGKELEVCPTDRQQYVAQQLSAAGADAVLMSHAHILQPSATIGKTAVVYGLGNFVFYAESAPTNVTGIMPLSFPPAGGTPRLRFKPAVISGGLPQMLSGQPKRDAVAAYKSLGDGC